MKNAFSPEVTRDLERAEAELGRRPDLDGGLCFPSVAHALRFRYGRGPAMQAALGAHPRGQRSRDGEVYHLRVDGGRQKDVHELHATLLTIERAVAAAHRDLPPETEAMVLRHRDQLSFVEIGKRARCAPSTASAMAGRAESYVLALLREAGLVWAPRTLPEAA